MDPEPMDPRQKKRWWLRAGLPVAFLVLVAGSVTAFLPKTVKGSSTCTPSPCPTATDPGPRALPAGAGGFLGTLSPNEVQIEPSITTEFNRVHDVIVTSPVDGGLGPRFSSNSCASCHQYPAVGGSSPPSNPLFNVYQYNGATNTMHRLRPPADRFWYRASSTSLAPPFRMALFTRSLP